MQTKSHDDAPLIILLLFLICDSGLIGVTGFAFCQVVRFLIDVLLLLVAEDHVVILSILSKLVLDFAYGFLFVELWFFLDFISEEELFEGVALILIQEVVDMLYFLQGGYVHSNLLELRDLLLQKNYSEIDLFFVHCGFKKIIIIERVN